MSLEESWLYLRKAERVLKDSSFKRLGFVKQAADGQLSGLSWARSSRDQMQHEYNHEKSRAAEELDMKEAGPLQMRKYSYQSEF